MSKMSAAGIVAIVILAAGAAFITLWEEDTVVTLSSEGVTVDSVILTKGGLVDPAWLRGTEQRMQDERTDSMYFAGWYTDSDFTKTLNITKRYATGSGTTTHHYVKTFESAFYEKMPVSGSLTLYAKWSHLSFSMSQTHDTAVDAGVYTNTESCVFTNDTSGTVTTVGWTVTDTYKISTPTVNPNPVSCPPPTFTGTANGNEYTVTLNPGRYDITLTATVDGETEELTRTMTVEGFLAKNNSWTDYRGNAQTLTYRFNVNEHLLFAEMNRVHVFKIPQIGSFAVWNTVTIKDIANKLKTIATDAELTAQESADLIASFTYGDSSSARMRWVSDGDYYRLKNAEGPGYENKNLAEYYKYPMEALYDEVVYGGPGDCDCKAILTAAIAKAYGFDSAIITITKSGDEGHAVAGIRDPNGPFVRPDTNPSGTLFLEPDLVGGYYAYDCNQGPWPAGCINSAYNSTFTRAAYPVT